MVKALSWISRVAANGAMIYIAELPNVDELCAEKTRSRSFHRPLARASAERVAPPLLAGSKDSGYKRPQSQGFFLEPPNIYFVAPERFIAMAEKLGPSPYPALSKNGTSQDFRHTFRVHLPEAVSAGCNEPRHEGPF